MSTRDNRRDARFDTRQKLWCEGQGATAEARNMSRSGMFIVSDDAKDVGETLTISLKDEEGEVEVDAEVMWRGATEGDKDGMGLRIVGFKKGQEAFDRFVERHVGEDDEITPALGSRRPGSSGPGKNGPG